VGGEKYRYGEVEVTNNNLVEPDVFLTKKDKETLRRLEHLSATEALRAIGCEVEEVKTPHGNIIIIKNPFMKESTFAMI